MRIGGAAKVGRRCGKVNRTKLDRACIGRLQYRRAARCVLTHLSLLTTFTVLYSTSSDLLLE